MIDTISPVASAQVDPGTNLMFRVDDTYTSMLIEVQVNVADVATYETAYDSASGGAQSGYTVQVEDLGSRHEFSVFRGVGWDISPFIIRVTEDEADPGGATTETTTSYTLATAESFPQLSDPYYVQGLSLTDTTAIHDNVAAEISAIVAVTPATGDYLIIEDLSDGDNKKHITIGGLQGMLSITESQISDLDHTDTNAIHDNVVSEISALVLVTAAAGDHILIEDASDLNNKKRVLASDFLSAGGAGGGMGQWDYVSGGGVPASTQITANSDTLSLVTTLNIADASASDNNFSTAFVNVNVGDYIVLRDNAGGAAHGTFLVSDAVDNTTYWTFTVTTGNVAGSFVATNTYDVWALSGGGAGGGGDVTGGSASADNEVVTYNSTTGKIIQRSDFKMGDSSPTVGTRTLGASANLVGGRITTGGSIIASGAGATCIADVEQVSGTASVTSSGIASNVFASAKSTTGVAQVTNSSEGSTLFGRCVQATAGTSRLEILSTAAGNFMNAYVDGTSVAEIQAGADYGNFLNVASRAGGLARMTNGNGGLLSGHVTGAGSIIEVTNSAGVAIGDCQLGGLISAGLAGFAGGQSAGGTVSATGLGSFAWGRTLFGTISATATNSAQFFEGTNGQTGSLQVGDTTNGIRLTAGGAAPTSALHNGDIWVQGSDVTIRSAGVSQSFTNPTVSGSTAGNVALQNLLAALATMNLIVDSTT